jgi:UDP-glucuronate 4-epimerase
VLFIDGGGGAMRYLVTGAAGFIGFWVARRLLDLGHEVVGLDAFTPYYDVALKERRSALLLAQEAYSLHRIDLADRDALRAVWRDGSCEIVIHLAAQAGVRYSLENPDAYIHSNLVGGYNVLDLARERGVRHLMIASTSSVYGANAKQPFQENDRADHPISLYAATKKSLEVMAHSYSHLFEIPTTAFRFFTVYGPWGRPDMAMFRFTRGILEGAPIDIYNHGRMRRDFTYIDDLVEAILRLAPLAPERGKPCAAAGAADSLSPVAPFRIVNIGGGHPVELLDLIEEIERAAGRSAVRNYLPMVAGDLPETAADPFLLEALTGYRPATPIQVGAPAFVAWYRDYYGV